MRNEIFISLAVSVALTICAAAIDLASSQRTITLPSRDTSASYCLQATRFRNYSVALLHLFCSRDVVLEYPTVDDQWTEDAKLRGSAISLMKSVSTLRSSMYKSVVSESGITRITVNVSPFTTICLDHWDISSRLRVHATTSFNHFYTMTFVICATIALCIRVLGPLVYNFLQLLFLFFALPFILLYALGKLFAPRHPRLLLAVVLGCFALSAWYLYSGALCSEPAACFLFLGASSAQAALVIYSLVIYGIYKMKLILTWPDDAGTRDLITWSLIVMASLPILFVAPLHSLPNQIIEKDVMDSSPMHPGSFKFILVLVLAKLVPYWRFEIDAKSDKKSD